MIEVPDVICGGLFIFLLLVLFFMISRPERGGGRDFPGENLQRVRDAVKLQNWEQEQRKVVTKWQRENPTPIQQMRRETESHKGPGRSGFSEIDGLFQETLDDYKQRGLLRRLFGWLNDEADYDE